MKDKEQLRLEKIIRPFIMRQLERIPIGLPERAHYELRLEEVDLAIREYEHDHKDRIARNVYRPRAYERDARCQR